MVATAVYITRGTQEGTLWRGTAGYITWLAHERHYMVGTIGHIIWAHEGTLHGRITLHGRRGLHYMGATAGYITLGHSRAHNMVGKFTDIR